MTLFDPPPAPASWRPTTPGAAEAIAAGEARADADIRTGLTSLRAIAANADDISTSGDATGKRLLAPERQMLAGMLDHLERSVAAHLTKENRHA